MENCAGRLDGGNMLIPFERTLLLSSRFMIVFCTSKYQFLINSKQLTRTITAMETITVIHTASESVCLDNLW